jgi:hypothetical protein
MGFGQRIGMGPYIAQLDLAPQKQSLFRIYRII